MLDRLLKLAKLMRLHGILTLLLSGLLYLQALMGFTVITNQPIGRAQNDWVFPVVQLSNGTLFLGLTILFIVASRRLEQLRSRGLILFAVYVNVLFVFTCFLTPTGLLLLFGGVLTLHSNQVRWAFEQVRRGRTVADVLANPLPYGDERDDYDDEQRPSSEPEHPQDRP